MIGELHRVQTADGLALHGMLFRPADILLAFDEKIDSEEIGNGLNQESGDDSITPFDPNDASIQNPQEFVTQPESGGRNRAGVMIYFHGVGSNFYQGALLFQMLPRLAAAGVAVLSVNTRGHDFVYASGRSSWHGSAYEIVDECRLDVDAWVKKATSLGYARVGLSGHSLGAIKVLYSEAFQPNPDVDYLVAISPSCLSASWFGESSKSEVFQHSLSWAENEVSSGKADQIGEVQFPLRLKMTPQTFIDKYGSEERYNILKFVDRIRCPTLVTLGSREIASGNPAFDGLDSRLATAIGDADQITLKIVTDADHHYSGVQDELAKLIVDCIR